jgi:hypothetical protein
VTGEGSVQYCRDDHKVEHVARALVPKEMFRVPGMKAAIYKAGSDEPSVPKSLHEALLRVVESKDKKINELEKKLREVVAR